MFEIVLYILIVACSNIVKGQADNSIFVRLGSPTEAFHDPQWVRPPGHPEQLHFFSAVCDNAFGSPVINMIPESSNYDTFTFIIGTDDNTRFVLLRNNEEVASFTSSGINRCVYDEYWIRWSTSERWLAMGNGSISDDNELFRYLSDFDLSIIGHKLSARGSFSGVFYIIESNQVGDVMYSARPGDVTYWGIIVPVRPGSTNTTFRTRACSDINVCLSTEEWGEYHCNDAYEVRIGINDNMASAVYDDGNMVLVAYTPGVLTCSHIMDDFWISWDENLEGFTTIEVGLGREVGSNILFSYTPETSRVVETLGFTSSNNMDSDWIITPPQF